MRVSSSLPRPSGVPCVVSLLYSIPGRVVAVGLSLPDCIVYRAPCDRCRPRDFFAARCLQRNDGRLRDLVLRFYRFGVFVFFVFSSSSLPTCV
jgi:hypothetical protein